MEIKEAQNKVDEWIRQSKSGYFSEITNTVILMEEVGEVARVMSRQYGEQRYKESDRNIDLGDEMADVLWVLLCLANQCGINMEDAFEKNLEKKNKRDRKK